jgi:hypothetical protein
MTNKFISPEQLNFTNECLSLYKEFCKVEDKNVLFNNCVKQRLDELLIDNSNTIDNILNQLSQFTDSILNIDEPYNRCENYKRMVKEKNKSNLLYIKKLFKIYNKSCRMSTLTLTRLLKIL